MINLVIHGDHEKELGKYLYLHLDIWDYFFFFFFRFHDSHGKHYSEAYGEGDTLGFMIVLPDSEIFNHIPNTFKDRVIYA